MLDKFYGWVIGTVAFAACCIGIPALIAATSVGAFSWLFGPAQALALLLVVAAVLAFRRSYARWRERQRHGTKQLAADRLVRGHSPGGPIRRLR